MLKYYYTIYTITTLYSYKVPIVPFNIQYFVAARDCLLSAYGMEYAGTIGVASSGQQCQYWNQTILPSSKLAVISDINSKIPVSYSGNECRNLDNDPLGPWCYTTDMERVYCNIPYCG